MPEDLKKPELTAQWEMKLSRISRGELRREVFMRDIRGYSKELIGQIKAGEGAFRHDNMTNVKCPQCGKRMLSVKGKNSQMLVCQDRECGYRETVARTSKRPCPNMHKKMGASRQRRRPGIRVLLRVQGEAERVQGTPEEGRRRRVQEGRGQVYEPAEERGADGEQCAGGGVGEDKVVERMAAVQMGCLRCRPLGLSAER